MALPTSLQRTLFKPSLRMVKRLTGGQFDHLRMRRGIARIERMLDRRRATHATTRVHLPHCAASWIDVGDARSERVILYIHGGGFVFETPSLHGALLANLCELTASRGLMLHYRLAPEHPYPAATEDCLDAYRYLLAEGYPAGQIVIAGDSAGGNLTLASLLRIRDTGLLPPAGAIALSPLTDATGRSDSLRRNAGHDPMFDGEAFATVVPLYLPDPARRAEPWASPLHGDLEGLPPVHLFVGSSELLLDDAVRFALKCPSATLEVWHDMPHVFPMFDFLPEAREAQQRIARHILSMLGEQLPTEVEHFPHVPHAAADHVPVSPMSTPAPAAPIAAESSRLPGVIFALLAGIGLAANLNGLAIATLIDGLRAPQAANSAPLILLIASLLFIVRETAGQSLGRRLIPLTVTLVLGSACGLPLFLFLRERALRHPH